MEKKYPIGIEPNNSKHQDIIFKVCKAHGVKSLELTSKHIALMSDCISEYIEQQAPTGAVWVKASERLPVNSNLVHLKYGTTRTDFKLTGYYEPSEDKWHRQDGKLLGWAPNLEWLYESAEPSAVPQRPVWVNNALQWAKEAIEFADKQFNCPQPLVETWGNMIMNALNAIQEAQKEVTP